jgi:hypothetical protein
MEPCAGGGAACGEPPRPLKRALQLAIKQSGEGGGAPERGVRARGRTVGQTATDQPKATATNRDSRRIWTQLLPETQQGLAVLSVG